MEDDAARDDGMATFDNERGRQKRKQQNRNRSGIRRGVDLTGPGAEAGVREASIVVMSGGLRFEMFDRAGHREDGQE